MAQETVLINFEVDYSELTNAQKELAKTSKVDTKGFEAIQAAIDNTATDSKGLIKTFKDVAGASIKMGKSVEAAFGSGVQDALDEAGVSVEEFGAALKKANAPAITLKKELQQLKEALARAKAEGKDTGKEFEALRARAGKLADAIADANAEIKNAGSDTRGIDNVVGSISALAGGYAAVQGAVALFGEENEDLQKALLKVNAAMALATGIQQISIAVQKEGALAKLADTVATGAQTAATTLYTFVTGGATVATKVFRAALLATGIGAIIVLIGYLVSEMSNYSDQTDEAKAAQDSLRNSIDLLNISLDVQLARLKRIGDERIAQLESQGASESVLLKERIASINKEISLLEQKEANSRKLAELEKVGSEEAQKLYKEANDFFYQQEGLKSQIKILGFNADKKRRDEQLKREKELLDKQRAFRLNDGTPEDILKSFYELSRQEIELSINKNKAIIDDERNTFDDRLDALGIYHDLKNQLIRRQEKFEVDSEQMKFQKIISALNARKKEEGANIKLINEQILKETAAYNLRLEVITGNGFAAIVKETTDYNADLKKLKDARQSVRQDEQQQIVDYDEWTLNQIKKARAAQAAGMAKFADQDKDDEKKKKERMADSARYAISVASQVADFYNQLSSLASAQERQRIDEQRNQLESLEKAGAITEKQAKIRRQQIDIAERKAIQNQAIREKQGALFGAILNTALAITNAISTGDPYTAALRAAIAAALGAAQIALISARPIPKFFRGKKDKYEGPGMVADMGSEIVERGGRMFLYTSPTQTYLNANDKVYTAAETKQILHNTNINTTVAPQKQVGFDYERFGKSIPKDSVVVNIEKDFISEAVANGLAKNNYFNKRYQFKK